MPTGVYLHKKHTIEERQKISQALKGVPKSEVHRKKLSLSKIGKKVHTEEHKQYLRKSMLGNKYGVGYKPTKEIIEKSRMRMLGNKQSVGRLASKETKNKMSLAHKGKLMGDKCIFWKGGISIGENRKEYLRFKSLQRICLKRQMKGSHTVQEWNELKRSTGNICLMCKNAEPFIGQKSLCLTEDHIIPISKGGDNNITNIQPLCSSCNSKKGNKIII
jgi:hypothetical protein